MKKKVVCGTLLIMIMATFIGCGKQSQQGNDCLRQTALLQSLMLGDYYGSVSVKDLKSYGDTGIGTFDGLNGELIMLDGEVYSALGDGSVQKMDDNVTVPFSDVTFMEEEYKETLKDVASMDQLKDNMTSIIHNYGDNYFYMAKIKGQFDYVSYRSELAQEEPYKPLADVMVTDQVLFESKNISGTIVALYCPDYMDGINTPGWHFHFISDDKAKGGHMLDVRFSKAEAAIDKTTDFEMLLPDDAFFSKTNLTTDLDEAINKVEKNE